MGQRGFSWYPVWLFLLGSVSAGWWAVAQADPRQEVVPPQPTLPAASNPASEKKNLEAKRKEPTFQGLWETNFGRMRLRQSEQTVTGRYAYAHGSRIEGVLKDGKLQFTYTEPNAQGEGWFELSGDGQRFSGQWREKGGAAWKPWNGRRVRVEPGIMWLVVVEANWETSLADHEYSFGQMLRTYFARDTRVRVRHRFFSDEASLKRWLSEVTYLAEPVVISLSTHGLANGIPSGGKIVGASSLAECLRDCDHVKLFHFSSCLAMKDQLADDIMKELGTSATFPISGYATSVDWAGSAVIEFMYFDLLLCRRLQPKEAAEQLVKLLPYAGDKAAEGAILQPAGFRIKFPEPAKKP